MVGGVFFFLSICCWVLKSLSVLTTGFLKNIASKNKDLLINEGWDLLQPFYVTYREIEAHELNYSVSSKTESV